MFQFKFKLNLDLYQLYLFQGCPKLSFLEIDIETLSQIQIHHSARLMGLRHMTIKIPSTRHLSNILAYVSFTLCESFRVKTRSGLGYLPLGEGVNYFGGGVG